MTAAGDRIRRTAADTQVRPASPFRRPDGRATYPHRVTLDLDDARYQWLRRAAYDARVPAAALIRAALDELAADKQMFGRAVGAAQSQHPSPAEPNRDERSWQ